MVYYYDRDRKEWIAVAEKRCYGCMKMKTGSPFCEHCGYDERTVTSMHHLRPGTVLREKYMVGKVLGQGGFGITYIGLDLDLNIPVAIKEYYPVGVVMRESGDSPTVSVVTGGEDTRFEENRSRFLREAQTLARLEDVPEVVQIKNYFAANNTAYIIMGYVKGITLKDYLRRRGGRLSADECFRLLRPMMEAMDRVHALGLVHRDISPDNIMIQSNGRTRLIDFGAAHEASGDGGRSTQAVLKHGFAPVEQYQSRGNLGPWTDVYAMCATVYYCLTGKLPPQATDRMMGEDAFDWDSIPDLTPAQRAVLRHGVEIHYQNRIQSMGQLCRGLFSAGAAAAQTNTGTVRQRGTAQQSGYQTVRQTGNQTVQQTGRQTARTGAQKKPKSIMGILVILALILCAAIVIYTSFFLDTGSSLRDAGASGGGGTSQATSRTVEVSTDLTRLGLNGKLTAKTGKDYTATLLPDDGWILPAEITVKVDGSKLSAKKYDYDPNTGKLTIPADQVTGDIEIIAEAEQMSIVGEWLGSVDLSNTITQAVSSSDPDLKPYFNFSGLTLDIRLVLTEGGVCKLSVDPSSAERLSRDMRQQLSDGFRSYIEDLLDEYGYTISVEDFLETMGYSSMDDFMDDFIDTDEFVMEMTGISSTGRYVVQSGKLYMTDDSTTDPLKVAGNPYTLSGNVLTIRASANTDESTSFMYPLVMKRVG